MAAAPATIEKPATKEAEQQTTTNERRRNDSSQQQQQDNAGTKLPAFLLRLWNDPYTKREFVARCLAEVCGK